MSEPSSAAGKSIALIKYFTHDLVDRRGETLNSRLRLSIFRHNPLLPAYARLASVTCKVDDELVLDGEGLVTVPLRAKARRFIIPG